MIDLATITNAVSRPFFRSVLLAKKFSPDILVGVGVVGVIAAAVLASRATLKLEEITTEHEDEKFPVDDLVLDGDLLVFVLGLLEQELPCVGVEFLKLTLQTDAGWLV